MSVQARKMLPFDLGGYHWGDDIIFDQSSGEIDPETPCNDSTKLILQDVIRSTLVEKCGYKLREIILFGFGQGGMVALNVAADLGTDELGGVVSIGGSLPSNTPLASIDRKWKTPVLLCKADRHSRATQGDVTRIRDNFGAVEIKEWRRVGDGMPSNREEMIPIMSFFARRLRSMRGVPEGAIELT